MVAQAAFVLPLPVRDVRRPRTRAVSVASAKLGSVSQPRAAKGQLRNGEDEKAQVDIVSETRLMLHMHGALVKAITAPVMDMFSEAASIGGAAFSVLLPESPPLFPTVEPDKLADPDSVFVSTPHRVRVHVKLVQSAETNRKHNAQNSFDALCLHGEMGSAFCFRNVLTGLSHALGGRVAAFDRPPYGLSELSRGTRYRHRLENAASLTMGTARALRMRVHAQRLVLIGHSLGGAVALRTALDSPGAVAGLVLLAPALEVRVPAAARTALRAALAVPPVGRRFVRERFRGMVDEERMRARFGGDDRLLDGYIRPLRRARWDEAMRLYLRDFDGFSLWDVEKQLRALAVPTLVVAADSDAVVSEKSLERLCNTLPNATLVRLPNTSHLMFENDPQGVVRVIEEWADRNLHA